MSSTTNRIESIMGAGDLASIAKVHYAGSEAHRDQKPAHYYSFYERFLSTRRAQPLRLLELGVKEGRSLLMWRDYVPNARIVGVDLRQRPDMLPSDDAGMTYFSGSQSDPAVLDRAAAAAGGMFDVIIDDAAHTGALAKASFLHLFKRYLEPRGLYFLEDYGTAYREGWHDGANPVYDFSSFSDDDRDFPSHSLGMAGLIKQIFDEMNVTRDAGVAEITALRDIACITKAQR